MDSGTALSRSRTSAKSAGRACLTVKTFNLPYEIRALIYTQLYRDTVVLLHPRPDWDDAYDWLLPSDEEGESSRSLAKIHPKFCFSLFLVNKTISSEVEPFFYKHAQFEIESYSGHNIAEPRLAIDGRIQHLKIISDRSFDDTLLFLDRHFDEADIVMHTLHFHEDRWPYDICLYD